MTLATLYAIALGLLVAVNPAGAILMIAASLVIRYVIYPQRE